MRNDKKDDKAFLQILAESVSPATCIEDARDEAENYYKKSLSAKKVADRFSTPYIAGITTSSIGVASLLATGLFSNYLTDQVTEIGVFSGVAAISLGLLATIPHIIAKNSEEKNIIKGLTSEISAIKREQMEAEYEASLPYDPNNLAYASAFNSILTEKKNRSFSQAFSEISSKKQSYLQLINQVAQDDQATGDFEPIS